MVCSIKHFQKKDYLTCPKSWAWQSIDIIIWHITCSYKFVVELGRQEIWLPYHFAYDDYDFSLQIPWIIHCICFIIYYFRFNVTTSAPHFMFRNRVECNVVMIKILFMINSDKIGKTKSYLMTAPILIQSNHCSTLIYRSSNCIQRLYLHI